MITVESLEIHVSNHCNLSCRGCSHISPLEKKEFLNEENMYLVLKKLSSVLHCKVIRLLGGEPTLNCNLENIVSKIKKIGISDEISIPTNGILISKLSENILNNIDIVEISNYNYNEKFSKNLIEWAEKNIEEMLDREFLKQSLEEDVGDMFTVGKVLKF